MKSLCYHAEVIMSGCYWRLKSTITFLKRASKRYILSMLIIKKSLLCLSGSVEHVNWTDIWIDIYYMYMTHCIYFGKTPAEPTTAAWSYYQLQCITGWVNTSCHHTTAKWFILILFSMGWQFGKTHFSQGCGGNAGILLLLPLSETDGLMKEAGISGEWQPVGS